jgi:hypothetical protein
MTTTKKWKKAVILHRWPELGCIVEGFGGMRIKDDTLHFSPKFQKNGKGIRLKLISETRF